ncbi:MAG TPA: CsgG/HfaB family protein [Thermoanaerobaculaceae bacterium]|nr:CsgG/HfaB family protein [Thermoanaerobaculaceae bacterium]HRS16530.1 CsgG/HfaB family protein [Thermoanaerobaculaceae bacterium]
MARRTVVLSLALALVATSVFAGKPRIAVLEFGHKALNSRWWSSGGAAQDMFITELVKSGKFSVIDRERLDALMREKNLSLGGDVDPSTAVKAGKLLGVEYFLFGNVTEFGEQENKAKVGWGFGVDVKKKKFVAALDCRIVNTTTGEIVWADTGKKEESNVNVFVLGTGGGVDDDRMFDKVLRPVVAELASKIKNLELATSGGPVPASEVKSGKIAKVEGATVWINLGSANGINVGDTFTVYELGEPIKDPDSGEVLGQDEKKIGRIRVTAVKGPKYSECTIVEGSRLAAGNIVK